MAIRDIVNVKTDEAFLRKTSRPVEKFDDRLRTLVDDMFETMEQANGVGLAAPQIGILKRLAVVGCEEGKAVLINAEILEQEGEQIDYEGCLSCPDKPQMLVPRPARIRVRSHDLKGKPYTFEAEGFFARAICHELAHLDGGLYFDLAVSKEEADRREKAARRGEK